MGYEKFVEIGRVAFIAVGPDRGKLAAIVDVVDQNRALVDGPLSGVSRRVVNFKSIQLTKFMIRIGPGACTGAVQKAWTKEDINGKWAETAWAKKLQAKARRAVMTDFDRFKLMKAKQARRGLLSRVLNKVVKENPKPKAGPKKAAQTK